MRRHQATLDELFLVVILAGIIVPYRMTILTETAPGPRGKVAAFSPDGRLLAVAGLGGNCLYDLESGRRRFRFGGEVTALAFSPDGQSLAVGTERGDVRVVDAGSGDVLCRLSPHEGKVRALRFSPDGGRLASGGEDPIVRVWDAARGSRIRSLDTGATRITALEFLDGGRQLATGGWAPGGHPIRLWDPSSGAVKRTLIGPEDCAVCSLAISPDGGTLAAGLTYNQTRLWDLSKGASTSIEAPGRTAVRFSESGRYLLGMQYARVQLWDLQPPGGAATQAMQFWDPGMPIVLAARVDESGNRVHTLDSKGTLCEWTLEGGRQVSRREGAGLAIRSPPWLHIAGFGAWLALWIAAAIRRRRRRVVAEREIDPGEILLPTAAGAYVAAGALGVVYGVLEDRGYARLLPMEVPYLALTILVVGAGIALIHFIPRALRSRRRIRAIFLVPTLAIVALGLVDLVIFLSAR